MRITYYRRTAFYKDEDDKINKLLSFICNSASHINRIRDNANELGVEKLFLQDQEFCPKQQW